MRTISSLFRKPKDKISKENTKGIIYKVKCKDCSSIYIGQTARALKTRIKEHKRAIQTSDKNSLLAQHHAQTKHEINLDDVEIIDH